MEDKIEIYIEAVYKEPIDGIPYSNAGLTIGITKQVEEEDMAGEVDKQIQRLCENKFSELKDKLLTTRNSLVDGLRIELDKEYQSKLELARTMVKELQDEIKELKK